MQTSGTRFLPSHVQSFGSKYPLDIITLPVVVQTGTDDAGVLQTGLECFGRTTEANSTQAEIADRGEKQTILAPFDEEWKTGECKQ